jgi:hypothetical protein
MQMCSIPKQPKQKARDMGVSDLHEEEFRLFATEYNITSDKSDNKLDHYVKSLQ